jgi:hypothetical protein
VVSRKRPTFEIVDSDDHPHGDARARRGRPLREALGLLANVSPPDPAFADGMTEILGTVRAAPDDPWART